MNEEIKAHRILSAHAIIQFAYSPRFTVTVSITHFLELKNSNGMHAHMSPAPFVIAQK